MVQFANAACEPPVYITNLHRKIVSQCCSMHEKDQQEAEQTEHNTPNSTGMPLTTFILVEVATQLSERSRLWRNSCL